jgi:hypothetical protein
LAAGPVAARWATRLAPDHLDHCGDRRHHLSRRHRVLNPTVLKDSILPRLLAETLRTRAHSMLAPGHGELLRPDGNAAGLKGGGDPLTDPGERGHPWCLAMPMPRQSPATLKRQEPDPCVKANARCGVLEATAMKVLPRGFRFSVATRPASRIRLPPSYLGCPPQMGAVGGDRRVFRCRSAVSRRAISVPLTPAIRGYSRSLADPPRRRPGRITTRTGQIPKLMIDNLTATEN